MINRFLLFIFTLSFVSIAFTDCNNTSSKTPSVGKDTVPKVSPTGMGIQGSFSNQTKITFDSSIIKKFVDSFPKFRSFQKDITAFYKSRNYAYAWYDDSGMIEPAHNLYNRIVNIRDEGMPGEVPYKAAFIGLMETEEGAIKIAPVTELMLTSQYLAYAKKVWQGISEKQSLSTEWLLPRKKLTTQQLLDSLVNGAGILQKDPVYRQYHLLKDYLKKYNQLNAQGPLTVIKGDKKVYKLKDSSATVGAIRQRLYLLGDVPANNQSNIFDSALLQGVKNFEHRLGYKEDGLVNTALLAEMNYPLDKRIEQLIVNMERSRWVPVTLINNYLVINIPEYKLHVYENDSIAFSMNVVVGKDEHKTVIFNGELKYIVFSPYWNIPASILKNETLPAMRKNPNYLVEHNMEWNGGNVRQKPGPDNSLGLVKFLFPNTHSIYLHDTPAKSLFNEDKRAFSHGCIRLAEPKKLAEYLLRNDSAWNEQKITEAMNKGVEQYVTLKKTLPVFIAYFTAWVDRQGKLNFRNDVYKRDARLAKMMLEKPGI
ncbi:L,D-transpeptidase family protein [Ferruginibacter paludis]|uniref:L,D-transpeptidase family protein n=1 Tax=Ferruginibacter paludis TaxID=1310417 RepID=UPI0025B29577|nr:L,D-transpeptidase family protein [Ferruginibacter paludis]MDN3654740.1 L,D-transpeptidase family protein [Ferruginibacter paludis]